MHQAVPTGLVRSRSLLQDSRLSFVVGLIAVSLVPFGLRFVIAPDTALHPNSFGSLAFNALSVAMVFYFRSTLGSYPGLRANFVALPTILVAHSIAFIMIGFLRVPYDRLALATGLIIHLASALAYLAARNRQTRPRIGILPFGAIDGLFAQQDVEWQVLKNPDPLELVGCDALTFDPRSNIPKEWEQLLADATIGGMVVYQLGQLRESLSGKVRVQQLSENSFGGLLPMRVWFHVKTVSDWVLALLALPLLLPVLAIIALAIVMDSRGGAIFVQRRVGYRGKIIDVYKFRTMRAPDVIGSLELVDVSRITRIGGFLRRTRLDELPQLFNILKGEMSWIGPRPEAIGLSAVYTDRIPFYRYRHVVRPGISGWAQVNQGHVDDVNAIGEKLEFDFYYLKYFSPWLDLLIVGRTISTMITGFGAR